MKNWVGYKGRLKSLLLAVDEILYAQYQVHVRDFDKVIRSNIHFTDQLKNKEDTVMVLIDLEAETDESFLLSQWFYIDKSLLRRYKTFTASMIDCSSDESTIKEKDIGCQTLFSV